MTNRKTASLTPQRGLILAALTVSLSGCGMISSVVGSDKVDYRSAKKASTLDVPPDLTQLQKDNRYSLPDSKGGVATASGYNAQRSAITGGAASVAGAGVAVTAAPGIKVERAGNQRWLVVKQTPEKLWPQLKSFWEESGFTIAVDAPAAGIMETDWNENRAKLPQDFLRRTMGKVLDGLYDSGARDKYRTRLERLPDGSTEIYISHRGSEEVVQGAEKENIRWSARETDPNLEALFLARLMTQLGGSADEAQARTAVDNAPVQALHAFLKGEGATRHVETDEGFDRTWRRVGLALDRVGFTVEDRDRTQGLYFVRFVDQDAPVKGFFTKLFTWSWGNSEKDKESQRYRILVKGDGNISRVSVLNNDGSKSEVSPTGSRILTLLHEQLK